MRKDYLERSGIIEVVDHCHANEAGNRGRGSSKPPQRSGGRANNFVQVNKSPTSSIAQLTQSPSPIYLREYTQFSHEGEA